MGNKKSIHNLTDYVVILVAIVFCGCSSAVTRISIPVKVQSEIDIARYSNFVVLPFVNAEQGDKPSELGEDIAAILRRGLRRNVQVTDKENVHPYNFDVVSTQETARMLTREVVTKEWLSDTERLRQLGRYFEVKGLIIGTYKFDSDSRPRRYYGERYSARRQRYVMSYQDYMQKTYFLTLRILIIDVESEDAASVVVWDEAYRRSTAEAHTLGSFIFSQAGPQANTAKELSRRAVAEFTRRISPHYEREDRYLFK